MFTVNCKKPLIGRKIRLVTTQNNYLSIQGIAVYGIKAKTPTITHTKGRRLVNVALEVSTASQSSTSGNLLASNVFRKRKYNKTYKDVGEWFEVSFKREYFVDQVRVQSNHFGYNGRLSNVKVYINDHLCGKLPATTYGRGNWYTVKCAKKVLGDEVRLVTTTKINMSISAIKVMGYLPTYKSQSGSGSIYRVDLDKSSAK